MDPSIIILLKIVNDTKKSSLHLLQRATVQWLFIRRKGRSVRKQAPAIPQVKSPASMHRNICHIIYGLNKKVNKTPDMIGCHQFLRDVPESLRQFYANCSPSPLSLEFFVLLVTF